MEFTVTIGCRELTWRPESRITNVLRSTDRQKTMDIFFEEFSIRCARLIHIQVCVFVSFWSQFTNRINVIPIKMSERLPCRCFILVRSSNSFCWQRRNGIETKSAQVYRPNASMPLCVRLPEHKLNMRASVSIVSIERANEHKKSISHWTESEFYNWPNRAYGRIVVFRFFCFFSLCRLIMP